MNAICSCLIYDMLPVRNNSQMVATGMYFGGASNMLTVYPALINVSQELLTANKTLNQDSLLKKIQRSNDEN